jgi:streptomycin 6-kinase
MARPGIALFRALPETTESRVLLCTELHGGSILAAQLPPWLVIDPKPYLGNPAYDVLRTCSTAGTGWPPIWPDCRSRWRTWPGLTPTRVRQWLFARSAARRQPCRAGRSS